MNKIPHTLRFGADDKPPPLITLIGAIQQVGLVAFTLVVPLLLCRTAGASPNATQNVLSLSMIVLGIPTLLQALRKGPVGTGYLAPSNFSVLYMGPALQAVQFGGLGLMAGMTIFGGLTEAAISRGLSRLRPLLPPELAGLVIFLVGLTTGSVGVSYLLAPAAVTSVGGSHWLVAGIILATMIAFHVWTKGLLHLSCALIGIVVGYIASFATGLLSIADFTQLASQPVVALPSLGGQRWSFEPTLVLPFAIAGMAGALKAVGVITACQRMNDADWVRPDRNSLGRGILADGLGTAICGVIGTSAVNLAPSSVGLVAATGVASRRVAYTIAVIMLAVAFFPSLTAALILMPQPVVAAILVFTSCFILINGIQTIASRLLDGRQTFVIGVALIAGISVEVFPNAVKALPPVLEPLFRSAVVFGTLVALLLNLVFRVGIRQRGVLTIDPANYNLDTLSDFMQEKGAAWGARRDVILRAAHALQQLIESVVDHGERHGPSPWRQASRN